MSRPCQRCRTRPAEAGYELELNGDSYQLCWTCWSKAEKFMEQKRTQLEADPANDRVVASYKPLGC